MTVKEMIERFLRVNGFDGLCNQTFECGCDIANLAPCECPYPDCIGAYRLHMEIDGEEFDIYSPIKGGMHHAQKSSSTNTVCVQPSEAGEKSADGENRTEREVPAPDEDQAKA